MEIRHLQYFVAIADTLSFTRASEILYVSQSALSKQISALEQELGVLLFERDKRSVKLTDAGKLLLPEAKEILIRSEKIVPILKHAKEYAPTRSLLIGVDAALEDCERLHLDLSECVFEKRKEVPGLRSLFRRKESPEIQRDLLEGDLDLAVFYTMDFQQAENLNTRLLWREKMTLVYRSNHPATDDLDSICAVLDRRGVILPEKELTGMYWCMQILNGIDCAPQIRFAGTRADMMFTMESGESTVMVPESVALKLHNPNLIVLHFPPEIAELYCVAAWNIDCGNALVPELVDELEKKLNEQD